MSSDKKDLYFVAVKLFLRRDNQLLITHDIFGAWDLPGGRIRITEFDAPLENVIKRKVKEELGASVEYELGKPLVFFRVERIEQSSGEVVHIFAIGYEAKITNGEPELGDHHNEMKWVDVKTFKADKYFTGGWLTGVQEYLGLITI